MTLSFPVGGSSKGGTSTQPRIRSRPRSFGKGGALKVNKDNRNAVFDDICVGTGLCNHPVMFVFCRSMST